MVTSGTFGKQHFFTDGPRLRLLHRALLTIAEERGWSLEAWAVFPNHYHFIGVSPVSSATLVDFIRDLHARTAMALNRYDHASGRKVWHN